MSGSLRAVLLTAIGALSATAGIASAPAVAAPSSKQVDVQVWLAGDRAGAERFATAVSTPGDPQFHHYLTPDAYTQRFGATPAQAAGVARWLTTRGMRRVQISSGRDYVAASGTAATVASLQHVGAVASTVLAVTGLNDAAVDTPSKPFVPSAHVTSPTCAHYWGSHQHVVRPTYRAITRASLPACGYSAPQLRAAYGADRTNTGTGQTVALTESEPPTAMPTTLRDYARTNHLPAPRPGQFRQVTAKGGGSCDSPGRVSASPTYNDEAEMDSEAVYAMAPDARQLMVVGSGCDEDQALLNSVLSVLHGDGRQPSASIVSNSWQIPEGDSATPAVHALDVRAAAEGVGMYFSSGDAPGLTATASDPFAVAVGGTSLGVGARHDRVFETGWSDDTATLVYGHWSDEGVGNAAGGGASRVYRQPAYQKGVVPASMSRVTVGKTVVAGRVVPDIAADADLATGMLTGYIASVTNGRPGPYRTKVNAGTSLACPLVAGLVADAQQGERTRFGFTNPLIYRLAGTAAVHDVLPITASTPMLDRGVYVPAGGGEGASVVRFDAQDRTGTDQVTATGYDTMTGVGTPNGTPFVSALRRLAG